MCVCVIKFVCLFSQRREEVARKMLDVGEWQQPSGWWHSRITEDISKVTAFSLSNVQVNEGESTDRQLWTSLLSQGIWKLCEMVCEVLIRFFHKSFNQVTEDLLHRATAMYTQFQCCTTMLLLYVSSDIQYKHPVPALHNSSVQITTVWISLREFE